MEPAGDEGPAIFHAMVDFYEGRSLRGWGKMDHFDMTVAWISMTLYLDTGDEYV